MSQRGWCSIVLHEDVDSADELLHREVNETDATEGLVDASPACLDVMVDSKMREYPKLQ